MEDQDKLGRAVEILIICGEGYDPYELLSHDKYCDKESRPSGEPPSVCHLCFYEWEIKNEAINVFGDDSIIVTAKKYLDLYERYVELGYPIRELSDEDQVLVRRVHQEKKRRKEQIEYQARCEHQQAVLARARERMKVAS